MRLIINFNAISLHINYPHLSVIASSISSNLKSFLGSFDIIFVSASAWISTTFLGDVLWGRGREMRLVKSVEWRKRRAMNGNDLLDHRPSPAAYLLQFAIPKFLSSDIRYFYLFLGPLFWLLRRLLFDPFYTYFLLFFGDKPHIFRPSAFHSLLWFLLSGHPLQLLLLARTLLPFLLGGPLCIFPFSSLGLAVGLLTPDPGSLEPFKSCPWKL